MAKTFTSAKSFVRVWQKSASVEQVAGIVGVKTLTAYQRATTFRKHGVPLVKLPLSTKTKWQELADYAKSLV